MKALVVVASGLHLGYIGCYGNEWIQTPTLDRLAAEGIVFDQHYADQPDAVGANRAWQTGCYQFPSVKSEEEAPYPATANLVPLFEQRNIATFLIRDERCHRLASMPDGWRHGQLLESAGVASLSPQQLLDALAQALTCLAPCKEWLLRLDLTVGLPPEQLPDELHDPQPAAAAKDEREAPGFSGKARAGEWPTSEEEVPAPEDLAYRHLQARYAAVVTKLDCLLGCIFRELEQRRLLEEMLVLVTADHGQRLGEDQTRPASRLFLHEELIHIPLLLGLPGKAEAGRRVAALTQSVDLLPTLFAAFGLPLPALHGQSLLPLARGESDDLRPYACAGLRTGDLVEWALRSPDWAFLLPVSIPATAAPIESELYLKPEDRWEVNNVRQQHLELAERLEQTLREFVAATRRPGPLRLPALPRPGKEPTQEPPDQSDNEPERRSPI